MMICLPFLEALSAGKGGQIIKGSQKEAKTQETA